MPRLVFPLGLAVAIFTALSACDTAADNGLPWHQVSHDVCWSRFQWDAGSQSDVWMLPGSACQDCHGEGGGARVFTASGTAYMPPHQADGCFGRPDLLIQITDANGVIYETTTNEAGNFWFEPAIAPIALPYRVSVFKDGVETPMRGEVMDGDCNRCHTQNGADSATGRITP